MADTPPMDLLKGADEPSVGRLRLEAAVEEERVLTRPPGLGVRNTCEIVSTIISLVDHRATTYPKQ
jgi:hypothetical protein